jgi:hypothetical protein
MSATCAAGEPSEHRCDVIVFVDLTCDLTNSALGATMCSLADAYGALGRHQDALVLQQKTLEFWRRVQPENHTNIGAT